MILGNGYIPYHFRVRVAATAPQELDRILQTATGIKRELEAAGRIEGFPDAVIDRLARIPGVMQIYPDGAISSVVNPLKVARSYGGRPCAMVGVVGRGPIADAIRADLASVDIALHPIVRETADSSLEISLWDAQFRFWGEFQIHFLRMRERSHSFRPERGLEEAAEALVFSRVNQSRTEAAGRLFDRRGLVSFCIGGFTRHVYPEAYLCVLESAQQVIIRYPEIRSMGQALGIVFPRHWQADPQSELLLLFAERLATYGGGKRLVMMAFRHAVCLYAPEVGLATFQVPDAKGPTVPVGEFHGAVIAESLARKCCVPGTSAELDRLGNTALQAVYPVSGRFPLEYPTPAFVPVGTWRVTCDAEADRQIGARWITERSGPGRIPGRSRVLLPAA